MTFLGGSLYAAAEGPLHLWYNRPADKWTEALPLGNGRIGAMVHGGVETEHLQLNEGSLTSGEPPSDLRTIDITSDYNRIVDLLRSGRNADADALITKKWLGRNQQCYQPLGDLFLDFGQEGGAATDYQRWLDLATATAGVSYRRGGVGYTREVFISHPDQILVVHLKVDRSGLLSFGVRLSSVHPTAKVIVDDGKLVLRGQLPGYVGRRDLELVEKAGEQLRYPENYTETGARRSGAKQILYGNEIEGKGMFFEARLAIRTDGRVSAGSDSLRIEGASEAVLILSAATSYNGYDKSPSREGVNPTIRAKRDLGMSENYDSNALKTRHVQDYSSLFKRLEIDLGHNPAQESLPTDERIASFSKHGDPALAALCYQLGRYLMISGSRRGSQPLNLQGIWNDRVIPPWASSYTVNINTEMNYWPAETTNLSECIEPLLSVVTSKPASCGHFKTSHPEGGLVIGLVGA